MPALLNPNLTRERWLLNACDHILDNELGPITEGMFKRPVIRVSLGFPKGGRKIIGFCYVRKVSESDVNEIFITPTLSNSIDILGVLVHELIHATDNCESGHKGFFRKTAKAVGLVGKMTATRMSDELSDRMFAYAAEVGPIPHAKINLSDKSIKKQGTRMLKIECNSCGFVARAAKKWTDRILPGSQCPCCGCDGLHVV